MAGWEGDSVSKLVNPRNSYSSHMCTAAAVESNVARFPVASNIWPFLRLEGILNQSLDIFILISSIRRT